jgi:hypothetical protein
VLFRMQPDTLQGCDWLAYLQANWLDPDDAAEHANKLDNRKAICQRAPLVLRSSHDQHFRPAATNA